MPPGCSRWRASRSRRRSSRRWAEIDKICYTTTRKEPGNHYLCTKYKTRNPKRKHLFLTVLAGAALLAAGPATVTRNIQTYHYLRPIPQGQLDNMRMDDAEKAAYQNPGYPVK